MAPGTPMVPGPTFELGIRQVPEPYLPEPITVAGPLAYGGGVYDIELNTIQQVPELSMVTTTVAPGMSSAPFPGLHPIGMMISLKPYAGVPLEACTPAGYNEVSHRWELIPGRVVDPDRGVVTFEAPHLSKFTLLYGGIPGPIFVDPAPLPPGRLLASSSGSHVSVAWSNPTDPDLDIVRVLRSTAGFAEGPSSAGHVVVHQGRDVSVDESLPPGTYYYTAFARDLRGTWSSRMTAQATVAEPPPNQPPVAADDTATATADTTLTVAAPGVLANDSDPDGDSLTATLVAEPATGTLTFAADGSYAYRPPDGFTGTVTFSYRASDGTTVSVTADVSILVGPGDPAHKSPTTTTIGINPRLITVGQMCTISGTVTADGEGLRGARVLIDSVPSLPATVTSNVGAVFTDDAGRYALTLRPVQRTTLIARFEGNAQCQPSTSTAASVAVRAKVGTPYGPTSIRRNRSYVYRGSLVPAHANRAYAVRIYRYRLVNGRWRAYGYVAARVTTAAGRSTYSQSIKLPYRGKWRLRAYHADALHAASWSPAYRNVTVR